MNGSEVQNHSFPRKELIESIEKGQCFLCSHQLSIKRFDWCIKEKFLQCPVCLKTYHPKGFICS